MAILIWIKISCNLMLKISEKDYHSLELKIQTEIKKIFSEFLEDLENKTVEPDETATTQEQTKPGHPSKLVPAETTPAPAEPKKDRKSKRSSGINKILYSASHADTHQKGNILESDMAKILRKKTSKKI
jgi:hypothetical protein